MRLRSFLSALVLLAGCAAAGTAQPSYPKAQPKQLPEEVRTAWRKAGGKLDWYPKPGIEKLLVGTVPEEPRDFPIFDFDARRRVSFAELPTPGVPFGVSLYDTRANAVTFRGLATLKGLQSLSLSQEPGLTDEGLKELAQAADLRALMLNSYGTKLTAAGLKHLAALEELRELSIDGSIPNVPGAFGLRGGGELVGLKNLRVLKLGTVAVNDAAFKEIASLKELRSLHFSQIQITDTRLAELGKLPRLQFLEIRTFGDAKGVTAEGLKHLAGLTDLRELILYDLSITDQVAKHLAALKELRVLVLYNSPVGDETLKHLAGLTHLRHLVLASRPSRITDVGVKHLAGLKNLQFLSLRYAEITDDGAEIIAGIKSLGHLDLAATSITNAGVKHLAALPEMRHLDLQGNAAVTAASLKHLHELKKLTSLALYGTKSYGTPERDKELDALRKALPKCEVETANNYGAP